MQGFNQVNADVTLEEASARFDTVSGRVSGQLAAKGFITAPVPPRVQDASGNEVPYNGWIPPDLTALSDNQLGWYLGMLSSWFDYVQQQLAEAQGAMTVATAKLEFVNAHLLMIYTRDGEKKRSEPERKALVLVDRRYVEAQTESIYYETYFRHVKAIASAAEQNYSAVSRRVSQRQQDVERQKRVGGLGNIGGTFFRQP